MVDNVVKAFSVKPYASPSNTNKDNKWEVVKIMPGGNVLSYPVIMALKVAVEEVVKQQKLDYNSYVSDSVSSLPEMQLNTNMQAVMRTLMGGAMK
jgi:hypothetical protein